MSLFGIEVCFGCRVVHWKAMPPKCVAVMRTPPAQSEDEDVSVANFIRGVATTVHRLNGDTPCDDGSALLEKFLKLYPPVLRVRQTLWELRVGLIT